MKKILLMLVALIATSVSAMAEDYYIVAGMESLCGSVWDGNDTNNQMNAVGNGTYAKTYANVAVAEGYQFKVVKNGTEWIGKENGENITFNVSTACDVTITFNPADNAITVTGEGVTDYYFKVDKVVAVGNGSGNWLNGVNWNPADDANAMTKVADGVYEISWNNVPAGNDYQLKFAVNGAWTDNFGGVFEESGKETTAYYNSGNITFSTTEAGTVKARLDLSNFDYATKLGATYTVTLPGASTPAEPTYFIKHPWGGGEWSWKQMEKNEDVRFALFTTGLEGTDTIMGYKIIAPYGGNGVNINTAASDENAIWIENPDIFITPAIGEECVFCYYPERYPNRIMIDPYRIFEANPHFDKADGTYTGLLTVHVVFDKPLTDFDHITYTLAPIGGEEGEHHAYDDTKGIVLTEDCEVRAYIYLKDQKFPMRVFGEYTITVPSGVTDIATPADTKAQKVIENGQVIIVKGDKKYSVMGAEIK